MPRLSELKDIDFVDISEAEVERKVFALYETITGRTLAAGDPVRLFILVIVNVIILLLNKLNYTGKQNLLKYSEGNSLDHLGVLVGTTRLEASGASAVFQVTLSIAREQETIVPEGTRISPEKNIYFATVRDLIIPAGETTAQVTARCIVTGEVGNGYAPGEIRTIVDPIPYVASIVNISTSEGGADIETDDSLRERIFEAPEHYSCAGSEGAYAYHAKSVSNAVIDVEVYSPEPGVVQVIVLLVGGVIPENTVLDEIMEKLSARTVRPLTDQLFVIPPEPVNYDLNVRYWIHEDADPSEVSKEVWEAVNEYKAWQRTKIGRDINPDELIYKMKRISGVKRTKILSPEFTVLERTQVAQDIRTTVAMEGSEEE